MGIELEKNVGARVSKALLRCLDRHTTFHHLRGSPVAEKTPGDVREAEFLRDRLNAPGEKILMPDRTGFALVRKHPVIVLRIRSRLQSQQPFDSSALCSAL
jgi:hypothetical protein